ncbi:hypothetical protein [Rubinisphaera margarita]|uniref:hypothetical protein n=1 Tax=Rubinisphaera margarita TaxID=2909586 RepID=UPI001EE81DCB|nr:hypothetical protein [Rubinisphaera margarita]MCG6158529.1 hypothetical protein [Rubinisphaera margarita]
MPRKTASRLELRRQAEAAEKVAPKEAKKAKKKKKAAAKRTSRRTKDAVPERKRLVWVIYTATLREEARFPYDQRAEAEERLEQLKSKGKRTYFMQPVKELLSGSTPIPTDAAAADEEVEEDLVDEETNEAESDEAEFDDSEDSDDEDLGDDDSGDIGGDDDD